ncbi:uncharacterized protein [Antedon mediterranea]|uniref:uncharacterized protein n=1 Tax=Antedon mediterranea TaxID=105859 RepID=UPI003AF70711
MGKWQFEIMEKIKKELTTVKWSIKWYTPSELAKKKKSFPIIVKIADSLQEDYNTGQVVYLHSVKEQLRFLAYDEECNEFSIPINSDINLVTADIQEESSVLLHEDLELPLKVKVNSNQHARLPDLMSQNRNLTIKQKDVMKYLIGTCISEDSGKKRLIESFPTECSNLSLQVVLMIRDGTDDQLILFEEHVQDVVHSLIDESTYNSYPGNQNTIVNFKSIEIEESSNAPQVSKPDTKNNQAKGKKKRFRLKYKKIMNIQKNPQKCTSQQQDDVCSKVEKIDGRPKGKRHVKKYTPNIDKGSNIIGEKSQNLTYETKKLANRKHYVDYEDVYVGSYNGHDYEDVLEIQHDSSKEEEGNSYNDGDYENKIYLRKDITSSSITKDVDSYKDDTENEDVDIQKDPREIMTDEEGNTHIEDGDGYLEVTDIKKGPMEMTDADEEGNNDTYREDDGYEDVDEEGNNDTYREDGGYEDVIDNSEDPREITADEEANNDTYREDDEYEDVIDIPVVPIGITADEESNDSNKDDEYLEVTDEDDDAYDYDKIDYQQLNKKNKCSKKDILPKLPPRNTSEEHRIILC